MSELTEEEIFYGMGMSDESSDGDVSRLITEEDLIDSLFHLCDPDKTGRTPASHIIDFVKFTISVPEDHSADLDNLRQLLDPDNTDALVDLDTCRFQISQWIEKIKPESVLADGPIVMKTPAKLPLCGVLDNEGNRQNFDQEDFLRPLDLRVDSPAVNLRKKLIEKKEENLKLRKDLESAEETSMFQSQKLDEMTKRIKSLQELVERREYAMAENADLKLTIATLEEEKKDQAERVKQLKKLNSNFKEQVFDLEQKLVKAQADVQIAEKQQNDIQENLFKQKHLWARTQEEKDLLEARLTENSYKVGELNGTIDSLKKVNCELKDQKMELELQLADTQQQLSLLKMKAAQFGVPDLSNGSDDEMIPVQGPSAVSTPKSNKGPKMSIGLELKRMMKEVTEKQEEMIEKISKFADGANTNDKRKTTASPVTFKKTIKKDFDFLSKKLYSLSAAMKTAEQRTSRMVAAYQQLKDENVRLRAVYEDSLQQMLDDSGGGQMSVDDRMQQVKEKMERGEQHIIDLEENIKALKSDINNLQTEKASLKHTIEEVQAEKESMVLEIKHLKRNNLEVAEKFHKAELKCSELGEELQNSNTIISRERQKYKHLEENLGQSQFEHRVDLEEIWKVIQKEVERDHQTEQEELQKTANSLKSQVAKEITTLKSQLYKTQATLTALKQKTKQLELPLGKPELNHSHASQTVDEDSTSPLVGLTPERDVMDGRDVSPKGKNSPLTRHPSIHEESEGRVSFHPVTLLAQSKSSVLVEQSKETEKKESKETCPEEETDQFFPLARRSKPPGRSPNSSKPAVSLEKVKEANLAKRREQLKHSTMPQLSELSETVSVQNGSAMDSGDCSVGDLSSQSTGSVTGMGDTPIKNPAYPSLPNDVLVNLGLAAGDKSDSIEQLNDQEVEEKFAQLALAFKTDKLTLEQRLSIQQRSRDLAEQNVEKEFQGVKDCTASLSQLCEKTEAVALLKTLQGHFEILQQSIVRVSSRAEVYGAVQQEDRMSKAIDVMIKHVENLKMIHEKEHVELEEARKFLQDNRVYNSIQGADLGPFDSMNLSKRSLSLAGNALVKGARRRNSVSVLPKMLGGMGGSFSLNQSSSMESISFSDTSLRGTSGEWATCDEDPKTRFQCAVANTTVRSAVTGVMRRASLDKSPPISTLNLSKSSVIEKPSSDRSSEAVADQKTNSSSDTNKKGEEDAFQRGFEQGVRAHLGREMTGLREQQQDFCDTLDHLMDQNELSSEEAECDKTDTSVIEKLWRLCPECYSPESGRRIRFTLAGFVCLMAMVSVFFTILPVGVASSLDHSDLPPM